METRAPSSSLCLFKETRVDLESPPSSIVQLQLPHSSPFSVRSRQQQHLLKTTPIHQSADAFSKACLATSGSIHFSRHSSYPRSILWRLLQEQNTLELRSGDLSKSERETKDAALTLQLHFPAPIKDGSVALADSQDPSILNVFALTKGNELYTCTIRKDFFCLLGASEGDFGSYCKIYKPATFSISTPHRLISGGPLQLIISLTDGRILQLTRDNSDDGSRWTESIYGDGQWGSALLGLVRWQGSNAVRFDGVTLEQNTPIALALSPDHRHIFAVCLNHTLRIWNPNRAASVFSKDLLWQPREPHDISKVMLDPGNANMLQMFWATSDSDGDLYHAVTFSPHDFGQFKFWGIRDPDHAEMGVRDLFPDTNLKAPDPDPDPDSKAIWKVSDFIIHSERDGQRLEMWVLMRSSRHYKLYKLSFDLQDLESQWQDSWCLTASETMVEQLPQPSNLDPIGVTEKWLAYLLQSGRYPESVLETGLSIYIGDPAISTVNVKASLKERMCTAVASRASTSTKTFDLLERETSFHREWTALHQDIQNLDKSRWEVLSLTYDNDIGLPQMVFADGSSVVRSCSRVEVISQNSSKDLGRSAHLLDKPSIETEDGEEPSLPDELAILIKAATDFRGGFNHRLQLAFHTALVSELWLDPTYSAPLRIQAFYDQSNFAEDIGAEQFTKLSRQLEAIGGFDNLDTASFKAIIDTFAHDIPSASSGMLYTNQGLKLLVNGAREMINLHERVLTDLLALAAVVEIEIDREEFPMENFDGSQTYIALLDLLKRYHVMQWLVTHIRVDKSPNRGQSPQTKPLKGKPGDECSKTSTILESIFAHDLKPQSTSSQTQTEALTENIQDLLQWVVGGNTEIVFEEVPVYIQCDLLKSGDIDLAEDFFGFQPSTSWSTYIKGRFYLMNDKPTEAAISFKKTAFKLSSPSELDYLGASGGLHSPNDSACFGRGLRTYYTHIIDLFTTAHHPTQSSQFVHLALQLAPSNPSDPLDQSTTTHLLESLFHASLSTTDISTAYSALTRHPSSTTALLPIFIKALLTNPTALPQLLSLPFPPSLHAPIDALLAQQNNPKTLAAWRMHHNDFRGAAAALLTHLQQAQIYSQQRGKRSAERELDEDYLTVINLLTCAGKDEGWMLSGGGNNASSKMKIGDGNGDGDGGGVVEVAGFAGKPDAAGAKQRKVVTLQDIRADYQMELDRRSIIENGRFEFSFVGGGGGRTRGRGAGETMDVS